MESMSVVIAVVAGLTITSISGFLLIPYLKRLNFGQTILEEGPKWHKAKQGTPTMGGFMMWIGVLGSLLLGAIMVSFFGADALGSQQELVMLIAGVLMAYAFGVVGWLDDYIKVVKKRNLGLRARQKVILQVIITALYLLAIYIFGDKSTVVNVPFLGQWDMGLLYYPVMGILIVGIVNSANLTDGIDGLLGGTTCVIGVFFMIATAILGLTGMSVMAAALTACCVGFLMFNLHPAKVFMGDTGSFFLGGMVVALAFGIGMPLLLFFVAFMYCIESLSVILQIISMKTRKKRIFKMSPIHHHFEMVGWSENKIVVVWCVVTAITCGLALLAVIRT